MSEPAVSILIVNYKAYEDLTACLASFEGDVAAGRVQAIVVDNASDERAFGALLRRFPTTTGIANRGNPGFAVGVNQAAAVAKGRWLLLLNPDAVLRPGAADILAAYLRDHPEFAVAGARVLDPDGTVQRSARSFPTPLTGLFGRTSLATRLWPANKLSRANLVADEHTTTPIDVDWVAGSCLMVRADVFRQVGGMDESFFLYWEDADLCRRIRTAGWRCAYVPEAVAVHQVGRSSRHASTRSIVAFHRSALQYYRKHQRGAARLLIPFAAAALAGRALLLIARSRAARAR